MYHCIPHLNITPCLNNNDQSTHTHTQKNKLPLSLKHLQIPVHVMRLNIVKNQNVDGWSLHVKTQLFYYFDMLITLRFI